MGSLRSHQQSAHISRKSAFHRRQILAAVVRPVVESLDSRRLISGTLDTGFDTDGKVFTDFGGTDTARAIAIDGSNRVVVAGDSGSSFILARYLTDGSLDSTFDGDGLVTTAIGSSAQAQAIAIIPSGPDAGKIVVGGFFFNGANNLDFVVSRYLPNGSLDAGFGTGGTTVTNFAGTSADQIFAIALQSDGKIIAVGSSGGNFALARFTAAGALDGTFGTSGKVTTDIGTGTEDQAASVAIDSSDRIVVVGTSDSDLAVARYTVAGALDASFDGDGKKVVDIGSGSVDVGSGVAIDGTGRIIASATSGGKFAAVVFTSTAGALDGSFDGDGIATTTVNSGGQANGIAMQSYDNRIVVAGQSLVSGSTDVTLVRYNTNGSLDTTFGIGGIVTTDLGTGSDHANAIAYSGTASTRRLTVAGKAGNNVAVARYDANITPVTTEGTTAGSRAQVVQNGNRLITAALLNTTDADNTAAELTYSVTGAPAFGTMQKSGLDVSSFTQADLDANLVTYKSSGSLGNDSATFSITDGFGGVSTGTLFVTVVVANDVYVDDTWNIMGPDTGPVGPSSGDIVSKGSVVGKTFGVDAFAAVNDGIAAVTSGGNVHVLGGAYIEDVNVNKTIDLIGSEEDGVATVSGAIGGSGSTVSVIANNVEIYGFTITREGNNPTDWNNAGLNSGGVTVQGLSITGLNLHNNTITGNRTGVDINNSNGHTITNNTITSNRTGLIFRNQTDNMAVVENNINDNFTVGVLFLDASGGTNTPVQTALNSTFSNNNLSGNWYGQIVDRQSGGSLPAPGTTNLKNFSSNWFGTSTPVVSIANSAEPGYAAQIPVVFGGTAVAPGGQPDVLGPASANFDITPYLEVGADTQPANFGFQGDFSTLNTTAEGSQTGAVGRIHEAAGLVTSGGTVKVRDTGVYNETGTISQAVTIKGIGSPTITRTAGSNQKLLTVTAQNVAIENLNFSMPQPFVSAGVYGDYTLGNFSGISVKDSTFTSANLAPASLVTPVGNTRSAGIALIGSVGPAYTATIQNNSFNTTGAGLSTSALARGVWLYQMNATVGGGSAALGNDFNGSSTQDLLVAASLAGTTLVQNNNFNAAGLDVSSGGFSSTVNVTQNTFTQPDLTLFGVPSFAQAVIVKANTAGTVTIDDNDFFVRTVGIFSGGSKGVSVTNNDFNAVAGMANYSHVIMSTGYPTNSGLTGLADNSLTVQGNDFIGAAGATGRALDFQNAYATGSGFGPITLGGAGPLANNFSPNLTNFIRLTTTNTAPHPAAGSTPYVPVPFAQDLSGGDNNYDVGGGLQMPAVMSPAQLAALEAKVFHKNDNATLGLVTFVAGNAIYVSPAASPTPTDNDYTRIANALAAAGDGYSINLIGNFDWTELNAAASWATGNDGLVGTTGDNYTLTVPVGLDNILFTAPGGPGTAEIKGPGDLSGRNLERVFNFGGGDNKNWTISNLRIVDFDLSIGMFNGAGGSDAFEGTTITNNFIRIPTDLNATVAPVDVNQNIGIHYSFGKNQTISNNTIEIAGDGVSAAPNFSTSVGMQSNTSGGDVYDGLLITGNIINVTQAQDNTNPQVILGIWENAHGHLSDITVSNNQFNNLNVGNDPNVNLQRAVRVTSHSSATSTVTYSGNSVDGANIGFQWIAGSNFAGNLPVEMVNNTLDNVATGALLQSNGVAHFTDNTLANTGSMLAQGVGIDIGAGSVVTIDDLVDDNSLSGFNTAIRANGSTTISGNNASITGNAVGIDVIGGTTNITGNAIYNNTIGVRYRTGGGGTVSGNNFDQAGNSNDNSIDLQIAADAGAVTIGAGNTFGGNSFFIDNLSTQNFNLTAYTSSNFEGLTDDYRIEDAMHHRVDTDLAVTTGLVTWVANNLFVTAPGGGSTDSSIQRGHDAASSGNVVNVESGTYSEVINISKSITIDGQGNGPTPIVTLQAAGANSVTVTSTNPTDTVTIADIAFDGVANAGSVGVLVNASADFASLTVNRSTFTNYSQNGVAVFGNSGTGLSVDSVSITNTNFNEVGNGGGGGSGSIQIFEFNGAVTLNNVDVTNTGNDARQGIQLRGIGSGAGVQPIGTVSLTDVDISGSYRNQMLGIQRYANLSGLSFNNVALGSATSEIWSTFGASLRFDAVGLGSLGAPSAFNLGNTRFRGLAGASAQRHEIEIAPDNAVTFLRLDATGTSWDFAGSPVAAGSLTISQALAVEDRVLHYPDKLNPTHGTYKGFVDVQNNRSFVTDAVESGLVGEGSFNRAIDVLAAGVGTVYAGPGTYTQNVLIGKDVTLLSSTGRATTTIQGVSGVGAFGTVQVSSGSTDVNIGGASGNGFTIVGIDNGSPGIENAALYFQGNHSGAEIRSNEVVANGDLGLVSEFGLTVTGFVIDNNIFSGQTFVGPTPADTGFANQFTTPNVPRQLVAMGAGSGSTSTSNITFTNNQITGTAGGTNGGGEQGNTLVTIDAIGSTFTGNAFSGTTTRFATSLRARGANNTITGNTFNSATMGANTVDLYVNRTGNIIKGNSFASSAGTAINVDANGGATIGGTTLGEANSITSYTAGIAVTGSSSSAGIVANTLTGNTIGVVATGTSTNVSMTNNFFVDNATAVSVGASATGTITLDTNSFTDAFTPPDNSATQTGSPSLVGLVNASAMALNVASNWWGSANGPTSAFNNSPGSPKGVQVNSTGGPITIVPWFTDGIDSNTGLDGFQHGAVDTTTPVPNAGGDQNVSEGALVNLLGSFTDTGLGHFRSWTLVSSTVPSQDINAELGLPVNTDNYSYAPADNGTYTFRYTVTDFAGNTAFDDVTITVNNVDPTAVLNAPTPINENASGTYTWSLTSPTDPSVDDTAAGFRYAFDINGNGTFGDGFDVANGGGDGTYGGSNVSNSFLANTAMIAALANGNRVPPGPPTTFNVGARILDDNGGFTNYNQSVTVSDVAPTSAFTGAASVGEGGSYSLNLGQLVDPGAGDVAAITSMQINWGDGVLQALTAGELATIKTGSLLLNHTYNDGLASPARTIIASATHGTKGIYNGVGTLTIDVNNLNPFGSLTNGGPVNAGDPVLVSWIAQGDPSPIDATSFRYAYDFDNNGTWDLGSPIYGSGVASSFTNVPGSFTVAPSINVKSRIMDKDGGFFETTTLVAVNPVTFRVSSVSTTPSGFDITFNRPYNQSVVNLYGASPDVLVTLGGNPLKGSLIFTGSDTLSWVATGGVLAGGAYIVTLESGSAVAFVDADATPGDQLDGNSDNNPGDDYIASPTVAAPPSRVIRIADFTRGPGQDVDIPATAVDLPVTLSDALNVNAIEFTLRFDPNLLSISSITAGADNAGWTVFTNTISPGEIQVSAFNPSPGGLLGGSRQVLKIVASVPGAATYGRNEAIRIEDVEVSQGFVTVPAIGDTAVHAAAFVGDANGSQTYTTIDAAAISFAAILLIDSFPAYANTDSTIIGDVNNSGSITTFDAVQVAQEAIGINSPLVPNNPPPLVAPRTSIVTESPGLLVQQTIAGDRGGAATMTVGVSTTHPQGAPPAITLDVNYDAAALGIDAVTGMRPTALASSLGLTILGNFNQPGRIRIAIYGGVPVGTLNADLLTLSFRRLVSAPGIRSTGIHVRGIDESAGVTFAERISTVLFRKPGLESHNETSLASEIFSNEVIN